MKRALALTLPIANITIAVSFGSASSRGNHWQRRLHTSLNSSRGESTDHASAAIDRQSDVKYGRGISHISADLTEGDVIAYQDGTWYVDGTEVGDGSPPTVRYMIVDTIQLVWTHDCEHGVINGFDTFVTSDENESASGEAGTTVEEGSYFVTVDDYIQVGPEQVLARIPTELMKRTCGESVEEVVVSRAAFDPVEEMMAPTS